MDDKIRYEAYLKQTVLEQETLCKRCGACCGRFESDPCSQLRKDEDGLYSCAVYEKRLGIQKTISGREFTCIPVRKILFESWSGSWKCAYKKTAIDIY
jgi:hypothetical protein